MYTLPYCQPECSKITHLLVPITLRVVRKYCSTTTLFMYHKQLVRDFSEKPNDFTLIPVENPRRYVVILVVYSSCHLCEVSLKNIKNVTSFPAKTHIQFCVKIYRRMCSETITPPYGSNRFEKSNDVEKNSVGSVGRYIQYLLHDSTKNSPNTAKLAHGET